MWLPNPQKLVKLVLHSDGADVETPWAEDLGPAHGEEGRRLLRLGNVPYLHAKPTYEDVVLAERGEDGRWTWDTRGAPYAAVCSRLAEDAGRWTMIVTYALRPLYEDRTAAFQAMDRAGEAADMVVEGQSVTADGRGGRAYVAVPAELGAANSDRRLRADRGACITPDALPGQHAYGPATLVALDSILPTSFVMAGAALLLTACSKRSSPPSSSSAPSPKPSTEAQALQPSSQELLDDPYGLRPGPWKHEWSTCSRDNGLAVLAEAKRYVGEYKADRVLLACWDPYEGPSWTIVIHEGPFVGCEPSRFYSCDPYTGLSVTPNGWRQQDPNLNWSYWKKRANCFGPGR